MHLEFARKRIGTHQGGNEMNWEKRKNEPKYFVHRQQPLLNMDDRYISRQINGHTHKVMVTNSDGFERNMYIIGIWVRITMWEKPKMLHTD